MRAGDRVGSLVAAVTICGLAALGGGVTYGAFDAASVSQANTVATGSVILGDNDAGTAMLALEGAETGSQDVACIQLTHTGTLASDVRHYATVSGGLAPHLRLRVTRGRDPSPSRSCSSFAADSRDHAGLGTGVLYDGPLAGFPASWSAGIVDPADSSGSPPESWGPSETHAYRYEVEVTGAAADIEGHSATASFTWEARNR